MSVLDELSSARGERTADSNKRVAARCLEEPALLSEVAAGLASKDGGLLADCAEVLTEVAKERPDLVAPFADSLPRLLQHKKTRARWEATHALALVANLAPEVIAPLLRGLRQIIADDKSVIVRDYAVDAVSNYARVGQQEAERALPILEDALTAWGGKQAGHALAGLANVARGAPHLSEVVRTLAEGYLEHPRGVVRKAAKRALRAADEQARQRQVSGD